MKKILVIGATSGIAEAFLHRAIENNYDVILAGRNIAKLEILCRDLKSRFAIKDFDIQIVDIENLITHVDFFQRVLKKHGDIDGCFIACGVMYPQSESEQNFEWVKQMVYVNYLGSISLLNILAEYFENRKDGFISCITSVAGDRGRRSNYIYGSTKAGLNAYLSGLRARLSGSGVFVQTIKLGPVDTPMNAAIENPPLMVSPQRASYEIWKALENRKEVVYIPWFWRYIMLVIRSIPEFIFKKMRI